MNIHDIEIEKIIPYENNAKKHPKKQIDMIARSIDRYGWAQPLVIDGNNVVVIGHGRLEAAKQLGLETVPCVIETELTEDEIRELRLIDNKLNESEWDMDLLAQELADLDMSDWDIDWGIDVGEIDTDFIQDTPQAPPQEPVSRRGDLYILGDHRLMCGDSTDIEALERLMDGAAADLVITDPPYNVNYGDKARMVDKYRPHNILTEDVPNDSMGDEEFMTFLVDAFFNMREVMRPGAAAYVFHASMNTRYFQQAFIDAGLKLSQMMVWIKSHFVLGMQDYQWKHEEILYGWKDGASHYFIDDRTLATALLEDEMDFSQMKKAELIQYLEELREGLRQYESVFYADKPVRNDLHPTMKPVELIGQLMRNSSKPGWNVLDPFGGSGTTLITAEQLGRKCFMMELEPRYVDAIIGRWQEFTGQEAVKL